MTKTAAGEGPVERGVRPAAEARWYCLDRDGVAMLCKDEADALEQAIESADFWPGRAPYHAVLLGDLAAERERMRALVQAVRDANRDAEDGDTFRLLKPGQERAWMALLAGLEGPNAENMMKVEFTKEWCMNMAKIEARAAELHEGCRMPMEQARELAASEASPDWYARGQDWGLADALTNGQSGDWVLDDIARAFAAGAFAAERVGRCAEALPPEVAQARQTAEYWKAEHLAGNVRIGELHDELAETASRAADHLRRAIKAEARCADARKPCTCDGAGRGPGRACVVKAGGRLGDLWRCAEGCNGCDN